MPLEAGVDEMLAFGHIAKSTRQRIRAAEDVGLVVVRHDVRLGTGGAGDGFARARRPDGRRPGPLLRPAARDRRAAPLHVRAARPASRAGGGVRMRPATSSTSRSVDAAATGDRPRRPRPVPPRRPPLHGPLGRSRRDAAAASRRPPSGPMAGDPARDPRGLRRDGPRRRRRRRRPPRPVEGEPMWGLYQHKLSFGGQWLELAGAHERVVPAASLRGRARDGRRAPAGAADDATTTDRSPTLAAPPPEPRASRVALAGLIDRLTPRAGCAAPGSTAGRSARPASPAIAVRGVTERLARRPSGLPVRGDRRASTSTGTTSSSGGRGRSRRRDRRTGPPRGSALPQLIVEREPGGARDRRGLVVRRPERRTRGRRDHRHRRQDHDGVPRRRPRSRPPASGPG